MRRITGGAIWYTAVLGHLGVDFGKNSVHIDLGNRGVSPLGAVVFRMKVVAWGEVARRPV
jgi:hypothetical protein